MLFRVCVLSWRPGGAGKGSRQAVPLQMELESTGPSIPTVIHDEKGNVLDSRAPSGEPIQFVFEDISWQQQIPWQEAAHRLEVAMYPFKKVREGLGSPWHVDLGQVVLIGASRARRGQPEQHPGHWEGVPGHLGSHSSTGRSKSSIRCPQDCAVPVASSFLPLISACCCDCGAGR